jgi:hypothetical protein
LSTLASDPDQFSVHARGTAHDDRKQALSRQRRQRLQIIQKRPQTTTFGLQIFLDSIFQLP